jgi:peptidoglycan/LPS O-acetylase OafA/YrhL
MIAEASTCLVSPVRVALAVRMMWVADLKPGAKPTGVKRFDYVDLLRGLSALVVLICHYQWFWDFQPSAPVPAHLILWPIYQYGGLAVQVFWALSGFVFWVAYGERRVTGRTFWLHRFARLYPLHFLTLLIMAGLQFISWRLTNHWMVYGNNNLQHFGLQLVMASNWFSMEPSFNAPIWSVSVEIIVYAAFVLFMLRPSLILALLLASLSFEAYHITLHQIPFCSAIFFLGVALGILAPTAHRILKAWTLPAALIGLALIVGVMLLLGLLGHASKAVTIGTFLGPLALVSVVVALDYSAPLAKGWHWIGLIAYSVYLLHMPVLVSLRLAGVYPPLWLFCAIVIVLSLLSYRFIEDPAQRWIRTVGKKQAADQAELAAS